MKMQRIDSEDEEAENARRKRQRVDENTTGSTSVSSSSPPCKFTFETYASMVKSAEDMRRPCLLPNCKLLWMDHFSRTSSTPSDSSFRMPSKENFPVFRDPKDENMHDPTEFLIKLDRQLKLHAVPEKRYGDVLIACLPDRLMQDYMGTTIIPQSSSWKDIQRRFQEKYNDPTLKNKLIVKLGKCVQHMDERVTLYEYTEKFQSLVVRITGGLAIDSAMNIFYCEQGFIPAIREKLASYRATKSQELNVPFDFKTLADLYSTAANIESGMAPRPGRMNAVSNRYDHSRKNRRSHPPRIAIVAAPVAAANKIEMTSSGHPVNVNKKHRRPTSSSSFSFKQRGGPAMRDGFGDGRGGYSQHRSPAPANNPHYSIRPDRNTQPRGMAKPTGSNAVAQFNGECYHCKQRGHKAVNCPTKKQ